MKNTQSETVNDDTQLRPLLIHTPTPWEYSDTDGGWRTLELKAQLAEAGHIVHPEPVPPPTQAQQLAWATTDLAKAKARLHRKNTAMSTAIMWISIGEHGRAQEVLNRGLVDL